MRIVYTLLAAGVTAASFAIAPAHACGDFGQPCFQPTIRQPTMIQPFGNGLIVNRPGQMPTTIQPFGNGAIINTPGQMPRTCQPFGNGTMCN